MALNNIILSRRKELGLTQEQLADYLGVTPPAVNKWEKGASCPDIALLAPLARLLKIDLNMLLEFDKEISRHELIEICRELSRIALNESFEKAFGFAEEKLRIYPNNDTLLHNLIMQLQGLLITANLSEEDNSAYLEKINRYYQRLSESENAVIRNGALYMLASYEMSRENYNQAEHFLELMPDRHDTPDKRMLQAGIYLKQDKARDAAKLMQSALLAAVSDVQMILFKLVDAEMALGNEDAANYVAERAEKAAYVFDLSEYNSLVTHFQIALANKDADRSVELLCLMLKAQGKEWSVSASPLYNLVQTNSGGASMEKMTAPMLKSMSQSEDFAFLWEHEGFKALLEEYGVE